jgi:hypothetical protein
VKLVTVPSAVFEHADLRKPLRDEEVVADRAGPRERSRYVRGPRQLDRDRTAGGDRLGKSRGQHRPVVGVAVIGRDEAHHRRQVRAGAAADAERRRRARALVGPTGNTRRDPASFAQPVERSSATRSSLMELQLGRGLRRDVAPGMTSGGDCAARGRAGVIRARCG